MILCNPGSKNNGLDFIEKGGNTFQLLSYGLCIWIRNWLILSQKGFWIVIAHVSFTLTLFLLWISISILHFQFQWEKCVYNHLILVPDWTSFNQETIKCIYLLCIIVPRNLFAEFSSGFGIPVIVSGFMFTFGFGVVGGGFLNNF